MKAASKRPVRRQPGKWDEFREFGRDLNDVGMRLMTDSNTFFSLAAAGLILPLTQLARCGVKAAHVAAQKAHFLNENLAS
jgi:hypothetical protein